MGKTKTNNARLIAAAHELLLTIKMAIGRIEIANKEGDPILSAWLPQAKAIVAKNNMNPDDRGKGSTS